MKQKLSDEELIARLRSGVDPHEYRHEWGCTVLEMAAQRIQLQNYKLRLTDFLGRIDRNTRPGANWPARPTEKKKDEDLGVETGNERLL